MSRNGNNKLHGHEVFFHSHFDATRVCLYVHMCVRVLAVIVPIFVPARHHVILWAYPHQVCF